MKLWPGSELNIRHNKGLVAKELIKWNSNTIKPRKNHQSLSYHPQRWFLNKTISTQSREKEMNGLL